MFKSTELKNLKKYFFNTGWLMADKVLRLFVGLFVGVYVARYLGPERLGLLSFAISFVGLFGPIATLGLDMIVVRSMILNPEEREELLGTAFGLRLIGGLLLVGLVFVVIKLTDNDFLTKLLVMIVAVGFVIQAFQVVDLYFQSQVMGRFSSTARIIGLWVSSCIKIFLIWEDASLVCFAWVSVIESGIIGLILCFLYIRQRLSIWRWRFRVIQAKLLLRDSWPLILSNLSIMVYMRIDQVMIKFMLDDQAVGIYAVAVRLSEAWYFVPLAITQSVFPAILRAKEHSKKLFYIRLQQFYDLIVWIAIAIAIPTTFLSNWLMIFLYGKAYSSSGHALAILVWAGVFVSMGVASGKWLLAENLQSITAINTAVGALINVMLNIVLIKYYGIVGAAISTVVSQFASAYLGVAFHKVSRINFYYLTRAFNIIRIVRGI